MDEYTEQTNRFRIIYIIFMIVVILFGMLDIYLDKFKYGDFAHYVIESGIMTFALASATYMWLSYRKSQKNLHTAFETLGNQKRELARWHRKHQELVHDMHSAIKKQMVDWGLSPSEIEVALYLIRGYSHKQISGRLEKSERTVRNQSLNIYKKTGMVGRSELTAFFLEDLFQLEDPEEEMEEEK